MSCLQTLYMKTLISMFSCHLSSRLQTLYITACAHIQLVATTYCDICITIEGHCNSQKLQSTAVINKCRATRPYLITENTSMFGQKCKINQSPKSQSRSMSPENSNVTRNLVSSGGIVNPVNATSCLRDSLLVSRYIQITFKC